MFCIFADPDFKGDVLGTFGDVANVGVASQRIGGFNINDKATSFWNRTNRTMCLFQDTNFRNPMRWQRPNSNPVAFALKIRPNEFSPNVGFFADDLTTAYGSCWTRSCSCRAMTVRTSRSSRVMFVCAQPWLPIADSCSEAAHKPIARRPGHAARIGG